MPRPLSKVAPGWWDYTTLDPALLRQAAQLTPKSLYKLSRPGFQIHFYQSLEEFFLAEALEYIEAWRQATESDPCGICGPIGPTEQLPLVARLVNALELNLRHAHFWGMDEWVENGKAVPSSHPLSFARTDMELCFDRIDRKLAMPRQNIHFPNGDLAAYSRSFDQFRCLVMQGGQGDVKHWAFNDPPRRTGRWKNQPPPAKEYCKLATRLVDLHPMTVLQNARTSASGYVSSVPNQANSVGPVETFKSGRVSIWHPGCHDNPFGMRLTTLMISRKIADSACPMSLLSSHPNVHFHYLGTAIGNVAPEMH
jgi:glucosamine-6-phosphate deaminase